MMQIVVHFVIFAHRLSINNSNLWQKYAWKYQKKKDGIEKKG